MRVLVINCGSSSLKYQLINMDNEKVLAKGIVEKIGLAGSIPNHETAVKFVFEKLTAQDDRVIANLQEINVIGHRVVHGGTQFTESVLIDEKVKRTIENLIFLAPLHNPLNLTGIESCMKLAPEVPQVAVFDTAFHQTMPEYAYLYGINYEDFQKYGIRKYGFHGTSHRYVSKRAAQLLRKDLSNLKVISCHLGNGASITAVKNGKSVDTSMGLTPLEGLMMGTRSGDLDPAVVPFLMDKKGLSIAQANNYLNKKCGILGVSGISSDFRDIEAAAAQGNERAQLALEMFCYRVKKYISSYVGVLNGLDALIFTAGLGENSPVIREKICCGLGELGIKINFHQNNAPGKEKIISDEESKVKIYVIPTNEELMIAKDAEKIAKKISYD